MRMHGPFSITSCLTSSLSSSPWSSLSNRFLTRTAARLRSRQVADFLWSCESPKCPFTGPGLLIRKSDGTATKWFGRVCCVHVVETKNQLHTVQCVLRICKQAPTKRVAASCSIDDPGNDRPSDLFRRGRS